MLTVISLPDNWPSSSHCLSSETRFNKRYRNKDIRVSIEKNDINQLIHDTRGPLNRISMQAELVKIVLENDMPKEKAIEAVNKIIAACQDCSNSLQDVTEFLQQQQ